MIYVDTSVILAELLGEERSPPADFWDEQLATSRLAVYETWVRLNARGLASSHGDAAERLFARLALVDLSPIVLDRALAPFPVPARTLDAFHLATVEWLGRGGIRPMVAAYDPRIREAALKMGYGLHRLGE
jgi:hypothetical protein